MAIDKTKYGTCRFFLKFVVVVVAVAVVVCDDFLFRFVSFTHTFSYFIDFIDFIDFIVEILPVFNPILKINHLQTSCLI